MCHSISKKNNVFGIIIAIIRISIVALRISIAAMRIIIAAMQKISNLVTFFSRGSALFQNTHNILFSYFIKMVFDGRDKYAAHLHRGGANE